MTTDKERAAAYRQIADLYESIGKDAQARVNRNCADELDPPKPTWADGTVAWLVHPNGDRLLCEWSTQESNWRIGGKDGDSIPSQRCSVEPLRVLADHEIALPRSGFMGDTPAALRKFARTIVDDGQFPGAARIVFAAADALDAEAGDAK